MIERKNPIDDASALTNSTAPAATGNEVQVPAWASAESPYAVDYAALTAFT